jgi:DNA modification methylase
MQIELINIDEIIPYENNAKLHPKEQIEQIKKSILEFGNNDPIAIDKNNVIVEGHGRLLALKELGYKEVEVIKLGHLTDEQRKAYTLIHNKLTMNTDFDIEILESELAAINIIDMSDFDFDLDIEMEESIIEDDYDVEEKLEQIEEPKSKLGDIYELGEHRLMCGDSTQKEDVLRLMNNQVADMLLTDPPYNVNISNSDGMTIENDNMSDDNFKQFLNAAFQTASASLKKGGAFYIWHGDSETVNFRNACENNELSVRQCLIWVKNGFNFGRQDYKWKHEPCLYGWKEGASHYFIDEYNNPTVIEDNLNIDLLKKEELKKLVEELLSDRVPTTIIHEDKPLKNDKHPTMKPINLLSFQIKNSSKKEEIVLDLFGGSGSTLIACEQLNRKCYMMEYDPKYVDVIIDRWEQLTGNKAVLL